MNEEQDAKLLPNFATMKEYLVSLYKHERLYGRGAEYGDTVVRSAIEYLEKHGRGVIGQYESRTGEAVWYEFAEGALRERKPPTREEFTKESARARLKEAEAVR